MQRVLRGARVVIVNLLFRTARDYEKKEKTMYAEREEKRREGG